MEKEKRNLSIKVLMYHRIIKDTSGNINNWHAVSEENFRKQMKILESLNFTPITFEDYQLYLDDKLTLPKKPIIITFDDGHLDTFEIARPILRELDMRAVIFIMGNRNLRYAVWDQKYEDDRCLLMTDEQVLTARSEGFEIGAHSMTHPTLPNLSIGELVEEIQGSKESIEKLLGERVLSFAYPFGRLDPRVYQIVRESGFKFACAVFTGPPDFGKDFTEIRRLAINYKTNTLQFLMRLLTPYEYVEWIYGRVKNKSNNENGNSPLDIELPRVDYDKTLHSN